MHSVSSAETSLKYNIPVIFVHSCAFIYFVSVARGSSPVWRALLLIVISLLKPKNMRYVSPKTDLKWVISYELSLRASFMST